MGIEQTCPWRWNLRVERHANQADEKVGDGHREEKVIRWCQEMFVVEESEEDNEITDHGE
jgi:hypothetical protein